MSVKDMRKYEANVILLAAGHSRRMGNVNKLLIPFEGIPMVRHIAQIYTSSFSYVHVVTGHKPQQIIAALSHVDVKILHNPLHKQGHNTSVEAGLMFLGNPQMPTLIALADQPYINQEDLIKLMGFHKTRSAGCITIPFYQGTRGHPIVIPPKRLSHIKSERAMKNIRHYLDKNLQFCKRYP